MSEQVSKKKVISSVVWKLLESGGVQVVQFIVSIIIARLVEPSSYGTVALLTVFVSIATVFVQSGLSTALIQKKDAESVHYSSVFYYSTLVAVVVYLILFFSAESIAGFYNMPELKTVLRIMSLTLFPGALNSVQIAILTKRMQFRRQFFSGLIAALLSGIIGIIFAKMGFGVWALVCQQLSYQVIVCIILWFLVGWRPTVEFSFKQTIGLLKYGSKLLVANLIDTIYHNLENLIIGKKYSEESLAFFSKGKQFPLLLIHNVNGSVQSVMFSVYSKSQDDINKIKSMLRRTMTLSTYLVFPAMIGLAVVAQPLISLLLGEKWLPCVPFLQIYCFVTMLFPMQTANMQAINAIGRSDIYLKLMIFKRAFSVLVLVLTVLIFNSAFAIVCSCLFIELVSVIVNFIPNIKLIGYKLSEQLTDIIPNFIISALMGIVVYCVSFFNIPDFLTIGLQLLTGVALYILISIILRNHNFKYLLKTIKGENNESV